MWSGEIFWFFGMKMHENHFIFSLSDKNFFVWHPHVGVGGDWSPPGRKFNVWGGLVPPQTEIL